MLGVNSRGPFRKLRSEAVGEGSDVTVCHQLSFKIIKEIENEKSSFPEQGTTPF